MQPRFFPPTPQRCRPKCVLIGSGRWSAASPRSGENPAGAPLGPPVHQRAPSPTCPAPRDPLLTAHVVPQAKLTIPALHTPSSPWPRPRHDRAPYRGDRAAAAAAEPLDVAGGRWAVTGLSGSCVWEPGAPCPTPGAGVPPPRPAFLRFPGAQDFPSPVVLLFGKRAGFFHTQTKRTSAPAAPAPPLAVQFLPLPPSPLLPRRALELPWPTRRP